MESIDGFSTKAENYARYRWGYAPDAISAILKTAQITAKSVVVELGAGTGILTQQLIGRVGLIYAIEPNAEMRRFAYQVLGGHSSIQIIDKHAEATGLDNGCADLVVAAQALHWFDPKRSRAEIMRILKPDGWLAILRNFGGDDLLTIAVKEICTEENGFDLAIMKNRPTGQSMEYYFDGVHYHQMVFTFVEKIRRGHFIKALSTAPYAPDEDCSAYVRFAQAVGEVFDKCSKDGVLGNLIKTELCLGQINK